MNEANCVFRREAVGSKKHKRFEWVCERCGRREPYSAVLVLGGCKNPKPTPWNTERQRELERAKVVRIERDKAGGFSRLDFKR